MALSTKHRVALFETLAPIAGEEPMNALLAEFPAAEGDELVTREFLRAELAELRTEFKSDIAELRAEFKSDIAELRTEFKSDIAELRTELKGDIGELRSELKGDIGELRAEMCDRFRRQTVWISSSFTVGMGLAVTIASLIP